MFHSLVLRDAIDDGEPNPRGRSLANTSVIFAVISTVLVAIRCFTRIRFHKRFGSDDYLIVIALCMAIGMTITYNGEAINGFGLHQEQVNTPHKILAFKYFFAAQILYKVAIMTTKVSLLLLYLRIFSNAKFRLASWITMGVVITYSMVSVLVTIFQCNPIAKSWNKKLPGDCPVNLGAVWYSTSALAIATDLAIIALPLNQLPSLKLPRAQKFGLAIMFSLGIFVIVTTAIRMATVGPAITQQDTTYYQAVSNSWTFLEVNVSIICACIPTLKTPLVKLFPRLKSLRTTRSSGYVRSTDHSRRSHVGFENVDRSARAKSQIVAGDSPVLDSASDEEIMLESVGIQKTMNVRVSWQEKEVGNETRVREMGREG